MAAYALKNTVVRSVKESGSRAVYPWRVCHRHRGGIMIDLLLHNSCSIINKLLQTCRGTEQWRAWRKSPFCWLFVTAAILHYLFCSTATRTNSSESELVWRLLTRVASGSASSLRLRNKAQLGQSEAWASLGTVIFSEIYNFFRQIHGSLFFYITGCSRTPQQCWWERGKQCFPPASPIPCPPIFNLRFSKLVHWLV